ncbi:MAG TPA: YciI family protein [Gemmatimonadales bacterium]|nr:YciI family protein [Gemmatimonadales bacterium]
MSTYAIIIIRYCRPMEEVVAATPDHRRYLAGLRAAGLLLASGPFDPRIGGMLLLRLPKDDPGALERIRDGDPFWQGGIGEYEMQIWAPTIGAGDLDLLQIPAGPA